MGVRIDVGQEFAGHRIEGLIGRGGMGVVYLAEHLRLGRKVAIKILSPELASDEMFRRRFIRESQLAAGLEHPNIVPVFDAGEVDDVAYISMRYVAGPDLSTFIKSTGFLDPPTTIAIVAQVASALDAAHARDLVHRDVKPANVLLEPSSGDGPMRTFLTDFGVTKNRTAAETTESGQFIGTIDYTAPEQIRGAALDGRTDQYALACVIFECLTGRVPYPYQQQVSVMYGHLQEPPPKVSRSGVAATEELDEAIMRGMAKRPDRRFESCMELVAHSASALGVALETPRADGRPPDAKGPRGRMGRVAAALAVALALVAGTVVALGALNGRNEVTTEPTIGPTASTENGSPSPSPSSSRTRALLPFPEAIQWVRVRNPGELGGRGDQFINRATVGGSLIVAVGCEVKGAREDGALWITDDGTRWHRKRPGSFGGPGDQVISAVTYGNDGFTAIGTVANGDRLDAAVWKSDDGREWKLVDDQLGALGGEGVQQFRKLISTPAGLVAVGSDAREGDKDGAVWVSSDGTDWTEDETVGGEGDQELWGVARFRGGFVAVGSETIGEDREDAAVWRGGTGGWKRVGAASLAEPGQQVMKSVVATPGGLIAVGTDRGTIPAVWLSQDGDVWTRVSREMFATSDSVEVTGVITFRGGAIMVGAAGPEGQREAAVWLSPDGRNWTPSESPELGGPENQVIKAIVPFHGRLIAVGVDHSGNGANAGAWVGTPITVSSPPPSPSQAPSQTPELAGCSTSR